MFYAMYNSMSKERDWWTLKTLWREMKEGAHQPSQIEFSRIARAFSNIA